MRLLVIACPVFRPELDRLTAESPSPPTLRALEETVHALPAAALHDALQGVIDETEPSAFDAIALAYSLCNRGIVGLKARHLPVVIPRAHDCLGMLLGSTSCYLRQLEQHPGTYFQSAGWIAHAPPGGASRPHQMTFGPASNVTREALVERYGEANADYLLEQFTSFTAHYRRLAYIATATREEATTEATARQTAKSRDWEFSRLRGDLSWLRRLLRGDWGEAEFLVLQPGEQVGLRPDERLIGADPG